MPSVDVLQTEFQNGFSDEELVAALRADGDSVDVNSVGHALILNFNAARAVADDGIFRIDLAIIEEENLTLR